MDLTINNKIVGQVINKVYITHRDKAKHYFYKYEGWGISEEIIEKLITLEINKIIIREEVDHLFTIDEFLNGHIFYYNGDKQYIASKTYKKQQKLKNWFK